MLNKLRGTRILLKRTMWFWYLNQLGYIILMYIMLAEESSDPRPLLGQEPTNVYRY